MPGSQAGVRDIFVDANGIRHHLVTRGAPGTSVVMMIHGLSGQARTFDAIAGLLASRHHVYCLDVRGRGESGWGSPEDYHVGTYVRDLEAIRQGLGLERMAIVGTSMGGLIAMQYAPAHPERVSRIAVNDIGPEIDTAGLQRIIGYITEAPEMFPDMKAVIRYYREHYAPMVAHLTSEQVEDFARHNVRKNDIGVYVWKLDPAIRKFNQTPPPLEPWAAFKAIACPVLLIRGAESDVLSQAVAARMVAEGKDCRVVEVPRVGHAPLLVEPAAREALESFLAG